jgi:hypothetical protein
LTRKILKWKCKKKAMKNFVSPEKVSKAVNIALFILLLTGYIGMISDDKLQQGLIGHWPLAGDTQDRSGQGRHLLAHGNVDLEAVGPKGTVKSAVGFNGRDSWLELPPDKSPNFGKNDFSIAVWLYTEEILDDVPGDIISQYDPDKRNGFNLSLKSNSVMSSHANTRQLHFGIDNAHTSEWVDCGRPGNAVLARSLAEHNGTLYAGTCEPGKDESGHVYSYAAKEQWIDCGAPDSSNSVMALAVYQDQLFAGTGKYRIAGSSLPESENMHSGGQIFRYKGKDSWNYCGRLPNVEAIGGMVVFRGDLYASSYYPPASFFRYQGDTSWVDCGTPAGKRVVALGVYNGYIYASSLDGGHIYRYDGKIWIDCGQIGENTQTYGFAVYQGRMYIGTWPSGRVYLFEDIGKWTDTGRLGDQLEVMGMMVYNGRLLAGTLPLAEIYSFEGDTIWKQIARLDHTPDVKYRRAWTMAEHDGKVFCSTLPSGRIFSFEAGSNITWGDPMPAGWHHVAAVKSGDHLLLYVDGSQVAQSTSSDLSRFDLNNQCALRIGFGSNDYLLGRMADLRLYQRALHSSEIRRLSKNK